MPSNQFLIGVLLSICLTNCYADFLAPLQRRLTKGHIITIQGTTGDYDNETSFNLQSGDCKWNPNHPDTKDCDIVFHFVTRFSTKEAIRTYYDHGWQEVETWGGFPFAPNTPYTVRMVVHDDFLEIFVNGNYFCSYTWKLPLNRANHVWIRSPNPEVSVEIMDNLHSLTEMKNTLIDDELTNQL